MGGRLRKVGERQLENVRRGFALRDVLAVSQHAEPAARGFAQIGAQQGVDIGRRGRRDQRQIEAGGARLGNQPRDTWPQAHASGGNEFGVEARLGAMQGRHLTQQTGLFQAAHGPAANGIAQAGLTAAHR